MRVIRLDLCIQLVFILILIHQGECWCPVGWNETCSSCLKFVENKAIYQNAMNECKYLGGWLVRVKTEGKQNCLYDRLRESDATENVWIGLMGCEGGYYWSDQTPLGWSNWGPGEPAGGVNNGSVTRLVMATSGQWEDRFIDDGSTNVFICETERSCITKGGKCAKFVSFEPVPTVCTYNSTSVVPAAVTPPLSVPGSSEMMCARLCASYDWCQSFSYTTGMCHANDISGYKKASNQKTSLERRPVRVKRPEIGH